MADVGLLVPPMAVIGLLPAWERDSTSIVPSPPGPSVLCNSCGTHGMIMVILVLDSCPSMFIHVAIMSLHVQCIVLPSTLFLFWPCSVVGKLSSVR